MTLAVADTGPIHYLVLIDAVGILPQLYQRIVVPTAVLEELTHPNAPSVVRSWASALPDWTEVRKAVTAASEVLGRGEAEALALAQELRADTVLLDETEARREAIRLGLPVSGTIGVLERAAERRLLDLADAFRRLAATNFRVTRELLRDALARDAARAK